MPHVGIPPWAEGLHGPAAGRRHGVSATCARAAGTRSNAQVKLVLHDVLVHALATDDLPIEQLVT